MKKIVLGIGSSGPTTKWGYKNYISLIKKINNFNKVFFYLLCGPDEKKDAQKIIDDVNTKLSGKVVTGLSELKNYCTAEEYHQKYLEKR